jgi:hypothetical protein
VRGYDYQPDGAVGQIEHHLTGPVFIRTANPASPVGQNPGGIPTFQLDANADPITTMPDPAGFNARRAVASFLMAYDSNFKPITGQQVTFRISSGADADARLALMQARSQVGECDLIAKGSLGRRERRFVYEAGVFRADNSGEPRRTEAELKALVQHDSDALTFTCVPPGSGYRIGIDRDADGIADGDEH